MTQPGNEKARFDEVLTMSSSRRTFLKRSALIGLTVPSIAGLLAACEEDSDDTSDAEEASDPGSEDEASEDADSEEEPDEESETDEDSDSEDADSGDGSNGDRAGGHMTIALASVLDDIHTIRHRSVPESVVRMNMLETITIRDTDGEVKPSLAESWEIDDAGEQFTFAIKDGPVFHDGTEFNAEAVKYNLDMHLDPEVVSTQRESLGPVNEVELVDDQTITVHMDEPFAPLLLNLAGWGLGIGSPTALEEMGDDFGREPVGTGPFMFEEWVPQERIELVKNPDYNWPPEDMYENTGPAYLDGLTFIFVEEEAVRMGTLETGETDGVVYLSSDGLATFQSDADTYEVIQADVPGSVHAAYLHTQRFPTDDVLVRQAINWAVDIDTMIDSLYGGVEIPGHGMLSPAVPCQDPAVDEIYGYDPEKAQELMEEAGFEMGDDGVWVKDGERAELQFVTLDSDRYLMYSEFIQASLNEAGFDVTLEPVDGATRVELAQQGSHHLVPLGLSGTGDPDVLRTLWHTENIGSSGTGYNFSHYTNSEVDDLLEQAVQIADEDERCPMYEEVQHILRNDATTLPIRLITHNWAHRTYVKGLRMDGNGYYPLLFDVYIEE
jgi:peptide/nickel transport system substrate-binding protein